MGAPPSCRPECVVSGECPLTRACVNQKCTDPCLGACGLQARCEVINHSPICSCREGQTGDPFRSCFDIPRKYINIYIYEFYKNSKYRAKDFTLMRKAEKASGKEPKSNKM